VRKLGHCIHSLISQKHFERGRGRKWIKRKKRGAKERERERAWDWMLGAKVKLEFGFLKN